MKKIFVVLMISGLLGCTDKGVGPKFVESASTSVLVEFGTLKPTDSQKLMSATIYNTTGSTIAGPATLSNGDFNFVAGYNCPNGAKNKASCTAIKLIFNPQGKPAGEYTATLDLGGISVPLHATIEEIQEPTPEDIAAGISSSMGDQVDFGTMLSTGNSVIKTITLTNGNAGAINTAIDTSSLSPFVLSYDACSNKTIGKGKKCQIKVSLSPSQLSGIQSGSLSYAGKEVSFSAEVITPASVAQSGEPAVIGGVSYAPNLQFLINNSVVSTYEVPQSTVSLNIVVKNTGNLASAVSTASLSGTGVSIVNNGCSNRSLSPNQSCTVKVVVAGSSQHSSSSSLSYSGVSLDLTILGTEQPPEIMSFVSFENSSNAPKLVSVSNGQYQLDNVSVDIDGTFYYGFNDFKSGVDSFFIGDYLLSGGQQPSRGVFKVDSDSKSASLVSAGYPAVGSCNFPWANNEEECDMFGGMWSVGSPMEQQVEFAWADSNGFYVTVMGSMFDPMNGDCLYYYNLTSNSYEKVTGDPMLPGDSCIGLIRWNGSYANVKVVQNKGFGVFRHNGAGNAFGYIQGNSFVNLYENYQSQDSVTLSVRGDVVSVVFDHNYGPEFISYNASTGNFSVISKPEMAVNDCYYRPRPIGNQFHNGFFAFIEGNFAYYLNSGLGSTDNHTPRTYLCKLNLTDNSYTSHKLADLAVGGRTDKAPNYEYTGLIEGNLYYYIDYHSTTDNSVNLKTFNLVTNEVNTILSYVDNFNEGRFVKSTASSNVYFVSHSNVYKITSSGAIQINTVPLNFYSWMVDLKFQQNQVVIPSPYMFNSIVQPFSFGVLDLVTEQVKNFSE